MSPAIVVQTEKVDKRPVRIELLRMLRVEAYIYPAELVESRHPFWVCKLLALFWDVFHRADVMLCVGGRFVRVKIFYLIEINKFNCLIFFPLWRQIDSHLGTRQLHTG